MSLNCFFGAELRPDGMPFTPVIPAGSSLVITQCAVTSAVPDVSAAAATSAADASTTAAVPSTYSAVTLYVQSSEVPNRLAVCTLSPGQQLYYCPLQLIFGRQVTFTLRPQHKPLKAGAPVAYPNIHLTGYYEKEDEEDGSEDDDFEDGTEDGEGAFLGHAGDSQRGDERMDASPRGRLHRPPTRAGDRRSV